MKYDLYQDGNKIATDVTSPYDYQFTGTANFSVKACNTSGCIESNIDQGTGLASVVIHPLLVQASAGALTEADIVTIPANGVLVTEPSQYLFNIKNKPGVEVTAIKFLHSASTVQGLEITNGEGLLSLASLIPGQMPIQEFEWKGPCNVNNFSHAFYVSGIKKITLTDTSKGTNWYKTFAETHNLECINKINTTNATQTSDMFRNTHTLMPTPADQAKIKNNHINWIGNCPTAKPAAITDFDATDTEEGIITVTFTETAGETYDLMDLNTVLEADIHSGYDYHLIGTKVLHVKAINSIGSTDSNINEGTGKPIPGHPTYFEMEVETELGYNLQDSDLSHNGSINISQEPDTTNSVFKITSTDTTRIILVSDKIKKVTITNGEPLTTMSGFAMNHPSLEEFIWNGPSNVEDYQSSFASSKIKTITLNSEKAVNFIAMCANCADLVNININTSMGEKFSDMFFGCSELICISDLDTRKQTTTSYMFDSTPKLQHPNATEQAALLTGSLYHHNCPAP